MISKVAAQAIVEEIGAEIKENINMMDNTGVIIASTDPERIGQMHEGARRIITEGLPELYISHEMETVTTRKGLNLPLIVGGKIVGVVGITGEKERIAGYGNIVRRMTEIMVLDSIQKDARRYDRRVRFRFIEEWLRKSGSLYRKDFIERGKHLGIDVTKKYRVFIICFKDYQSLSDTLEGQRLLEEMETSIRHESERRKILYLREPTSQICLVPHCGDEIIEKIAKQLAQIIEKKYGRAIAVGFDSSLSDETSVRQRYVEANKAVLSAMSQGKLFEYYDNLNIELFLNEISEDTMEEYLGKLFGVTDSKQRGYYMSLVDSYFVYDGSITRMAEALYMHKNTLQYKLKKMAEITGKDIRLPSHAPVYYMALRFYQRLYREENEVRNNAK